MTTTLAEADRISFIDTSDEGTRLCLDVLRSVVALVESGLPVRTGELVLHARDVLRQHVCRGNYDNDDPRWKEAERVFDLTEDFTRCAWAEDAAGMRTALNAVERYLAAA